MGNGLTARVSQMAMSKPKTKATKAKGKVRSAVKKAVKKVGPTTPRTVTPYLTLNDATSAIQWYKKVLGAKVVTTQPAGPGKLMHAALRIGDSELFLSDMFPGTDMVDASRAGASVTVHLWTKNADKIWQNAVANGAKVTMPIDDMFWGDRYGRFLDPFGHSWSVSTRSKLSKKALEAKRIESMKQMGAPPS